MIDEIKSNVKHFYVEHEDTIKEIGWWAGVGLCGGALGLLGYISIYIPCKKACYNAIADVANDVLEQWE